MDLTHQEKIRAAMRRWAWPPSLATSPNPELLPLPKSLSRAGSRKTWTSRTGPTPSGSMACWQTGCCCSQSRGAWQPWPDLLVGVPGAGPMGTAEEWAWPAMRRRECSSNATISAPASPLRHEDRNRRRSSRPE